MAKTGSKSRARGAVRHMVDGHVSLERCRELLGPDLTEEELLEIRSRLEWLCRQVFRESMTTDGKSGRSDQQM